MSTKYGVSNFNHYKYIEGSQKSLLSGEIRIMHARYHVIRK